MDHGTDQFVIRYAKADNTPVAVPIAKQGTNQWVTRSVQFSDALFNNNLPGGTPPVAGFDLELSNPDSGADIFHRVRVQQTGACNGTTTPSPSPTSTATPTRTSTPLPPTETPTYTPMPLVCLPESVGTIALDDSPKGMAAANGRLYVVLSNNPRLAIIRVSDNVLEATQPVGPGGVNGVAVANDRVYTTNRNAATLSINEAGGGAFLQTLPVGNLPWGVAAVSDRLYVANFADSSVTTINPITNSILRTTPVSALPAFVAAMQNRAYVTHINGHLSVIGSDGARLADLTPGASELWGIALNLDARLIYVADRPGNRILVLSTNTNQVVGTIGLPGSPYALAYNPGTGNLYAIDATTDKVYVVNTRNNNRYGGQWMSALKTPMKVVRESP